MVVVLCHSHTVQAEQGNLVDVVAVSDVEDNN